MILHYTSISPNSRRVLAAAYEMGYELELCHTDPDSPELLKLNPNGLVPVLEDEGFVLWESNAILQYLAERKGQTQLYPKDVKARAEIARWQFWTHAHFDPVCGPLLWENLFKQKFIGQGPDPKAVQDAEQNFHPVARILDQAVKSWDFLVGKHVTLADYSVAAFLMYLREAKIPLADHPHASRWFERVSSLPAWQRSGNSIPGFGD